MSLLTALVAAAIGSGGAQLIAFTPDLPFPKKGEKSQFVLEGIKPSVPFNELIPSWNVTPPIGARVSVEVRANGARGRSRWYRMGEWTLDDRTARQSFERERDAFGEVMTDTLRLKEPGNSVDVRLTLRNSGDGEPKLKRLALSFADTRTQSRSQALFSSAWGKVIEVPQRAQGNYPRGGVLCSPTSVSMVLWHYANVLSRPELNRDVPEVEAAVWDRVYDGAGNWIFNAAYAGSFPGMVSYVSRFRNIADLEAWIDAGFPVICSVSLDVLLGKAKPRPSGHLVVLVGFTQDGDPIFNDPAKRDEVRRTYKRENFERAWLTSERTVYVIHPEGAKVPSGDGPWVRG